MNLADLAHLAPFVIPIVGMFIPIVIIVMGALTKMRRSELMHETLRQMVAQGREIPPQLLDGSLLADRPASRNGGWQNRSGQLIFGATNVGVGLGVMVMFYAMSPGDWLWAIGCIPLFVGIALLAAWKIESKSVPR